MKDVNSAPNSLPMNFGGLGLAYSEYTSSKVAILPLPYEATTSFRAGTREGPQAIVKASRGMELYDEELEAEPYRIGIHTLAEPELSLASLEQPHRQVEEVVETLIGDDKFPVLVGGEHSLSLGAVRAFKRHYPDLTVLQLDAHADMRDEYLETPFSHACIARRISEICPIVQIGIRSMSREEAEFLRQGQEKNVLFAADMLAGKRSFGELLDKLGSNVYVTVDLDVFDPAEMPAVGTPEPGGLRWHQVLDVLRQVFHERQVVGCDVVELAPVPGNIAPEFMAARLIYKMIGWRYRDLLGAK